jgi:hypothetical protein
MERPVCKNGFDEISRNAPHRMLCKSLAHLNKWGCSERRPLTIYIITHPLDQQQLTPLNRAQVNRFVMELHSSICQSVAKENLIDNL